MAARVIRMTAEQAARDGKAWVMLASDLSNSFGSIDVDTLYRSLLAYGVESGTARFLAYVTKYRLQELKPGPPVPANVGSCQGKPDSPQDPPRYRATGQRRLLQGQSPPRRAEDERPAGGDRAENPEEHRENTVRRPQLWPGATPKRRDRRNQAPKQGHDHQTATPRAKA